MIKKVRWWLGSLRCRWFNKHTDILYAVGSNWGKECRFCKVHGTLTPEEIKELFHSIRGDDEVAMDKTPE